MSISVLFYSPLSEEWTPASVKVWNGYDWQGSSDPGTLRRSPFEPYLGEGSIYQRSVKNMPLATHSAEQAQWMSDNVSWGSGWGGTSLNTSTRGTVPIQVYLVDSRTPGTFYVPMRCGGFGGIGFGAQVLSGRVPWPERLTPDYLQSGQDSSIVIYDQGTGTLREYYLVRPDSSSGGFTAYQGGFSQYPRGTVRLADTNYPLTLEHGSNAVVRMHNWLGWIDIPSARKGEIDHALAFTCSNMALPNTLGEAIDPDGNRYTTRGPSWPAQAGDGDTENPDDLVPIHGQWARLPEGIDLSPYNPFLRMIIQAAQKFGIVSTDSNNFVHSFNAEPGFLEKQFTGVDPWSSQGDIFLKYRDLNAREGFDPSNPLSLADFPWHLTEWAPRHWGAPGRINEV